MHAPSACVEIPSLTGLLGLVTAPKLWLSNCYRWTVDRMRLCWREGHQDQKTQSLTGLYFSQHLCPKHARKQEVQPQNQIWHLLLLSSRARCIFSTSLSVHIFIRYGLHPTADRSTVLKSDTSVSGSWEASVKACSVNVVLERGDAAWILRGRLSVLFSTLASSHPSGWWKPP